MKNKLKNSQVKKFFLALFFILLLSGSVSAGTVSLCNRSGTDLRVAKFVFEGSSFFAIDCGPLGTEGCRAKVFNWETISNGYCKEYITGSFFWIYFAVQLKDRDGNWYSTSYGENKEFLSGAYGSGYSGLSNASMCVKDNTYSLAYDRYVRGIKGVFQEECQTGYSKVKVNLFAQTDNDTVYTLTVPYEAPPVKNYPNTVIGTYGNRVPACGYEWATTPQDTANGDYRVVLGAGFVATPTGVAPAKGYRWVRNDGSTWCSVEKIPVSKKTSSKRRGRKNR